MATIYFSLSTKVEVTNKQEILIRFSHGRINQRAKTNIFISSEYWKLIYSDKELEKVKKEKEKGNKYKPTPMTGEIIIPNPRLMNEEQKTLKQYLTDQSEKLNTLTTTILTLFNESDKTSIAPDWLKITIDKYNFPEKYTPKEKNAEITTLFQFVDKFLSDAPNRTTKAGRIITNTTAKPYHAANKDLRAFAKSQKKKDYTFDEIDQKFYDAFVSYLQSEIAVVENKETKILKKSFTQNTVAKKIKVLKTILNEAVKQGYNENRYFEKNFTARKEEVDNIYLTETELQQLKDIDLSKTPYLDRARDWFLLLAWTAQRFSDLSKITSTDIKDGFITFRQQKTNNKVTIPLHPVVVEILKKYNYNLPTEISNQKFNNYIKEVCQLAKINGTETITRTVGGKLVTETFERWQLVTSHTGRRSFCTNMYKQGIPTLTIMAVSGHETEKAFLTYIKVGKEEHAALMANKWAEIYGAKKN